MRPRPKPSFHWPLRVLFLLCPLVASASAGAQDIATAEALFDKGLEDMKAGRYETGCKAIAESQRLDPRPGTLFTLATCEAEQGRIATAVTRYGDYLAVFDRLPDNRKAAQGERPNEARSQREKLRPEIPQLTLSLPKDAPAGTVVKRDGEVVAEAALGLALPVDPGEHVVSVQVPGGPVQEQKITIARREKKTVTLSTSSAPAAPPAVAPPVVEPPQAPTSPGPSRSYVGPILAFGAAAVGLGVGAGMGAAVLGKQSELEEACPGKNCPESQRGNLEGAKALSHGSTAGFVLAGVGAAVGTVLLLLPAPGAAGSKKVGVRVGAGYVGVEGAF